MHIQLPHTIISGGEKITFEELYVKDGVEILQGHIEVQPKAGPPMHTHHRQDEIFTVVSGKMAYQVAGEAPKYAYPGETVTIKAGIPHKFWNAGEELLVCKAYVTPPDNFVFFLSAVYDSINANNGRPGMYDAAFLLSRYKSEFAMNEIPSFVQKLIFPVVLFFGNLLGKNKKFVGAPVAVR
ncbi:MAG: cupin domain-containing protein [Chitinophagaceae bacterium]|nr:cupin domain-containing protein [Chitinophagaceae bacterium]